MRPAKKLFWIEKAIFCVSRYPNYSADYMRQEIESQAIPKDELARYSEFGRNRRQFMAEILAIYTLISLKFFYYVYYTTTSVDFNIRGANFKPMGDGELGYTCLVSNCSEYIATNEGTAISLIDELVKLPVFALCKQEWKWFYNPILIDQKLALITHSDFACLAYTVCVALPIYMYPLPPVSDATVLFSLCPLAELNRIKRKIGLTLEKLSYSLMNFSMNRAFKRHEANYRRNLYHQFEQVSYVNDKSLISPNVNTNSIWIAGDNNKFQEFLNDYLPINRTYWWREKWIRGLTSVCPIVAVFSWLSYIFVNLFIAHHAQHVTLREQSDFLDSIRKARCSLWFNGYSNDATTIEGRLHETGNILTVEHLENSWNWFTIGELIIAPILPLSMISITMCNYYYVCMDMKVCIIELKFLLNIAIDYVELDYARSKKTEYHGDYWPRPIKLAGNSNQGVTRLEYEHFTSSSFRRRHLHRPKQKRFSSLIEPESVTDSEFNWLTSTISDRMTKMINFDLPILLVKPIDRFGKSVTGNIEARLVNQEFALDLMKLASVGNREADALVKLLEKIHVNYRTLVELLNGHNSGLVIVLVSSYFINYCFTLTSVFLYRVANDFAVGPLVCTLTIWILATFFISLTSSIHANLLKLDHVFWSMIGGTANCRDIRVQHFRCIWYKNLVSVEADGGLAIKVWNISITYVRILQLTFGSATIFALALNRYQ